ncbi:unnamed protein product [Effrenium voratum]|nr:unnamed protein product [Effrenium voratum]
MSAPEPEPAEPGVASGAAELGVALERAAGPTLLHFTREDGRVRALRAEEEVSARHLAGRFLAEEAAKRRKVTGSNLDERARLLRESQHQAAEQILRASKVAELLSVPGEIRFLNLHSTVERPEPELRCWTEHQQEAQERKNEILEVVKGRLTKTMPELFGGMEAALLFLGHHWPLHCAGGQYAVELWSPEIARRRVGVVNNSKKGVCLSFPWEMSATLQPRRRLFAAFASERGRGRSSPSAPLPAPDLDGASVERPQALHKALLAAQELLWEDAVFQSLRRKVRKASEESCGRWKVLRASKLEVSFQVVLDAGALPAEVTLGMKDTSNAEPEAEGSGPWCWLADLTVQHLRSQRRDAAKTQAEASADAEDAESLEAFQAWLQPRLEAAAQFSREKVRPAERRVAFKSTL